MIDSEPIFFRGPEDLRRWFEANHRSQTEQWIGYYKKGSGLASITWPESVDQALCFGWIDGIRKSIDEVSYKIRFTPRKTDSHWSDVNIEKVEKLKSLDLMKPEGVEAFENCKENKSRKASYEQGSVTLDKKFGRIFKENKSAWDYFQSQSPSYRKQCIWWIVSARMEKTKIKRLEVLIDSCQSGQFIPPLRWTKKRTS